MEPGKDTRKRTLVANIIDFLQNEINKSNLSEEEKESIEVAIQCLETAYEVTSQNREKLEKLDLLSLVKVQKEVTPEALKQGEIHKNLGNEAMKSGQYDEAVAEYTKAVTANPTNAVYFCNRAAAYSRLEKQQEAIQDCKKAIELDPTYGKAYGRLGIAYSNLNMYREAKEAYETALRYDPNNAMYSTNMKLAQERLVGSADSAAAPQNRPVDMAQFVNNGSFLQMAREMMSNPEFHNMVSGIVEMSHSGDNTFDALFEAGQSIASRMNDADPNFVEFLRQSIRNPNQPEGTPDSTDPRNNDEPNPGPNPQ